jgi:hypothetical protein
MNPRRELKEKTLAHRRRENHGMPGPKGADDLRAVSGKPVRFRFHLTRGSPYAFWVGPDKSGASRGCVAAGGPGFTSPADTVGEEAYRAAALVKP